MITLGITGGMGSGKSFISKCFEKHDVPVYDCDSKIKFLLNNHPLLKIEMANKFGQECYKQVGRRSVWDRDHVVKLGAEDDTLLERMGRVIDPYMIVDFKDFKLANSDKKIIAVESAIMIKSKHLMAEIDKLLVVTAPLEIRMDRIKTRDPFRTEKEIKMLLSKQPSVQLCQTDFMIDNDGKKDVDSAVETIINKLSDEKN